MSKKLKQKKFNPHPDYRFKLSFAEQALANELIASKIANLDPEQQTKYIKQLINNRKK